MERFSLGAAWSKGMSFISRSAGAHAALLIGLGVVVPLLLQYLIVGSPTAMMNPATMGATSPEQITALGAGILIVTFLSYWLQTSSYFASWRVGLAGTGESAAGAAVYGVVVALLLIVGFIVVFVVCALVMALVPAAGVILLFAAMLPLFAILYTAFAAVVALGMLFAVLVLLLVGSSMQQGLMPADVGAGAFASLLLALFALLLLWLGARLSCTAPAMAAAKSYNLFAAIAVSWRRTSEDQWKIVGYLALIGLGAGVILIIYMGLLGVSVMGNLAAGELPQFGIGGLIVATLGGIVFAYLSALVPAGIYLSLEGDSAAGVFD